MVARRSRHGCQAATGLTPYPTIPRATLPNPGKGTKTARIFAKSNIKMVPEKKPGKVCGRFYRKWGSSCQLPVGVGPGKVMENASILNAYSTASPGADLSTQQTCTHCDTAVYWLPLNPVAPTCQPQRSPAAVNCSRLFSKAIRSNSCAETGACDPCIGAGHTFPRHLRFGRPVAGAGDPDNHGHRP
jgi:hypothetical protein